MFGYLGWGDGYARLKGGVRYGWIYDEIPMETVKTELRRLAKKYDSE